MSNTTRQALTWNPQGKRKRGRPRNTSQREFQTDIKKMGCPWSQIEKKASNQVLWRSFVDGLYPPRGVKA
jgi:hypothetical protein